MATLTPTSRVRTRVYIWGLRESVTARDADAAPDDSCVDALPRLLLDSVLPHRVTRVVCGSFFAQLQLADGSALAFGATAHGRTGVDTTEAYLRAPTRVSRVSGVTDIAAGEFCTLFVTSAGALLRTGKAFGSETALPEVEVLPVGLLAQQVAMGDRYALLLTSSGTVFARGSNSHGQCGVAPRDAHDSQREWTSVALPRPAVSVATRCRTSYAVLDDGSVVAWGSNEHGSLGAGVTVLHSAVPVPVLLPADVRAACVSPSVGPMNMHTMLTTQEGRLFAWGSDYKFKTGVNAVTLKEAVSGSASARPHHGNSTHSAEIFAQPHEVHAVCFSSGADGDVTAIAGVAAAALHTLAWTSDGRLFEWGCGSDGRLGFPEYRAKHARYLYHEPAPRLQSELLGKAVSADAYKYQTVVVTEEEARAT